MEYSTFCTVVTTIMLGLEQHDEQLQHRSRRGPYARKRS